MGKIAGGDEAQVATNWLCDVYGAGTISRATCANWFAKFRRGERSLEDRPRSGPPSAFDESALRQLIEEDDELTTRELADLLRCDQSTVVRHLHAIGKVLKLGSWVPHQLSDLDKRHRVETAKKLLQMHAAGRLPFDSIVAQDETWIFYENVERHGQWVDRGAEPRRTAKAGLHPKKIMLSVFWTTRGVVHWELLPKGQNMNAELFCDQLAKVVHALRHGPQREKLAYKKEYVLLFDNARPHTAAKTTNKLLQLGISRLPQAPYSPDTSPCDYYLFRSLKNQLRGRVFRSEVELRSFLETFFESKNSAFWREGMEELTGRWEEIVATEGEYVQD